MKKILNNKLLFPSIIILFVVLIIALIILDANDIPSNNGVGYIHFDWIMIVCTCASALATFILAMISKKQNEKLSKQIDDLTEKLAILTMQRFGKKTETAGQLSFDLENQCILNEAEKLTEN